MTEPTTDPTLGGTLAVDSPSTDGGKINPDAPSSSPISDADKADGVVAIVDDSGTTVTQYEDGTVRRETIVTQTIFTPSLNITINTSSYSDLLIELKALTDKLTSQDGKSATTFVAQLPNGGNSYLSYQLISN